MNCCDYDCNQGRNCPARQTRRVKAGTTPPGDLPVMFAEPEPAPVWELGDVLAVTVFALAMLAIGFSLGRLMV